MHKVFGCKENKEYVDRVGAYVILIDKGKVGVVKTPKGYFLVGGGCEDSETDEQCLKRETLEEIGYNVFVNKKICSAETFCYHSKIGYFHPIQNYYIGELISKIQEPIETDHEFIWVDYNDIKGKMFSEMQSWALKQAIESSTI